MRKARCPICRSLMPRPSDAPFVCEACRNAPCWFCGEQKPTRWYIVCRECDAGPQGKLADKVVDMLRYSIPSGWKPKARRYRCR